MKKFIALAIVFALLMVSACSQKQMSYAVNIASLSATVNIIEERYEVTYAMISQKRSMFTDAEWKELQGIDMDARLLDAKVKQIFKLDGYQITISEVLYMYELAKDSYLKARDIVNAHKLGFTAHETLQLTIFDSRVKEMDKQIQHMIENPDYDEINNSLFNILTVAGTALKIILPMVLV